jgi:hypothetical protein
LFCGKLGGGRGILKAQASNSHRYLLELLTDVERAPSSNTSIRLSSSNHLLFSPFSASARLTNNVGSRHIPEYFPEKFTTVNTLLTEPIPKFYSPTPAENCHIQAYGRSFAMLQLHSRQNGMVLQGARLQHGSRYHLGIQDCRELDSACPGQDLPSESCPVVEAFWQTPDTFHTSTYAGVG